MLGSPHATTEPGLHYTGRMTPDGEEDSQLSHDTNSEHERSDGSPTPTPAAGIHPVPPAASHGLLSAFILFHAVAIFVWALPFNNLLLRDMKGLVAPYMIWSGLFQSWDTFAPNPIAENGYVKALVTTDARRLRVWSFPRMQDLGYAEKYRKERYRKFTEVLVQPQEAVIWPDVARHIAETCGDPSDLQEKVTLISFTSRITPWSTAPPSYHPEIFFDDYVNLGAAQ